MTKPQILLLNHRQQQCGVYQYGKRCGVILAKSNNFDFKYAEVESETEYCNIVDSINPIGIIYNYYPMTMSWLKKQNLIKYPNMIHYVLYHEEAMPHHIGFNYFLMVDSTFRDNGNCFAVPRPLADNSNIIYVEPQIPTIGSFGFGFGNKGFDQITRMVNNQFDEAIIRFQMPRAFFGDRGGERSSITIPKCYNEVRKPNIKLEITTDFLDNTALLNFLAANTVNLFMYDPEPGRGLSSVMDYIVCVDKPLAISNSNMFRHMPASLQIQNRSIMEVINSKNSDLQLVKQQWSHANFITRYETIINNTRKI
jgi:hypothetical protein